MYPLNSTIVQFSGRTHLCVNCMVGTLFSCCLFNQICHFSNQNVVTLHSCIKLLISLNYLFSVYEGQHGFSDTELFDGGEQNDELWDEPTGGLVEPGSCWERRHRYQISGCQRSSEYYTDIWSKVLCDALYMWIFTTLSVNYTYTAIRCVHRQQT